MPIFARRTLFWKYAAYFSALVSALLLLSGSLSGYFAYRQSTLALEELQRERAHFAATEIARFVERIEGALQATTNKFNTGGSNDTESLRLELIALLRHQPSITALHWIAPDGRERLAFSRVVPDAPDASKDWSADPGFEAARGGKRYVGPVSFRGGSEPFLTLAIARAPGTPVLVADVNLKFIGDVIADLLIKPAGVAYVVDGSGRLIAHPDNAVLLGNTDLSALPQTRRAIGATAIESAPTPDARNAHGAAVLAAAVPIAHLGWTVIAEQPRGDAFRAVYASIVTSIALVLFGVIAAIAASMILARHMVRPIRQLATGAREIGDGRLDLRLDVRSGDELEALGDQFNRMAARLETTNATQETVIAERTRELALANDAKTRFLAAASHDLRQPIHALSLFVGQLRVIPVAPEGHLLIARIEHSVETLQALLEALLDLSKLDLDGVTPQWEDFAVGDLLSRLVAELAPIAEAKGLALTLVPTSLWVRSDPLLLERILLNLLGNAIRYSIDGRVLLGCRRRGASVDLLVADTGVGIEPEHMPHIFQEFYRAGPVRGGLTPGLGLGLAIVRRLALLLDHPLTMRSIPGRGTLVAVRVPRVAANPRAILAPADIAHDLRGTRVLVIDDEAPAREALRGLLTQWGCDVTTAGGGDEALAQARNVRFDLVLCDLNLGHGESGLRVADRLRIEHGPALACAFITGESAPERIAEARASGHAIAMKPTKPGKLRALVEHLVHAR